MQKLKIIIPKQANMFNLLLVLCREMRKVGKNTEQVKEFVDAVYDHNDASEGMDYINTKFDIQYEKELPSGGG